ncbi:N-acetylornithine carbamoyltransferase [Marinoscillum sp.]|uniref:N-acetylornithine carbamoyltransferase n=1 Tax=Marinoscillum sp. TaxID=2024838 RepID=UPI003BABFC4F
MQHFTSVQDVADPMVLVKKALAIKKDPFANKALGLNKTLGLLFFNSSLRTRMSSQKAASNLGMDVIVMNVTQDSWQIEMEDGVVMNGGTAEHIREAAAVMGQYCDILGVRSFPSLSDRDADYSEKIMNAFKAHAGCPIVSLESATLHPLQSLADLITIAEFKKVEKPKVVLTWAPHIKSLPQAVPNSFAQWLTQTDYDFTIAQPEGFELSEQFTKGAKIEHNQEAALKGADFVYVKNWSSFHDYGKVGTNGDWLVNQAKLANTNEAKVMHCLPVRRNVVIADDVLDSEHSIVIPQAGNRVYSAQAVFQEILEAHG